ncbi:MAG: hypothetical protein JWL83_428 [Actinomycetia bacterium]|nr:hypothetical protein [Actinomycetes bacterium]
MNRTTLDDDFDPDADAPASTRRQRRRRAREQDRDNEPELHRSIERGRRRRVFVLVLLLVVVPLTAIGAAAGWVWWQLDPPGRPGATVDVRVTKGWGVPQIADELSNRDVIGSSFVFQFYARLKGAGPFQPGTYVMHKHLGARGAVNVLESGPQVRAVNLAVIPGLRLDEIAPQVGKQVSWLRGSAFLKAARTGAVRSPYVPAGTRTLEGLLWPDTYRVDESETTRDVLRTMVTQFNKEADAAGLSGANVQGFGSYDIVKVASLIQSEAKLDRDRPLIASVIYNRLRLGMPLEIDATVLYAVNKRSGITGADLRTPSPYNTYVNKGLPPTPISGITAASLEAALHPATTQYLYYVVAGKDGHHAFARTYAEHQANVDRARRAGLL